MKDIDLRGLIDMHIHSAPDTRPRVMDDIDLAQAAAAAGMRAIMLKSHVTLTSDRAAIAEKLAPGVRVLGGLALNHSVGGFNPAAVDMAIRMGARQIWMPTVSAANNLAAAHPVSAACSLTRSAPGLTILGAEGGLLPAVREILDLIASAGIALGTGHLSAAEIRVLAPAARTYGVKRMVVTHPELALSNISVALQQELARPGLWFERCYVCTLLPQAPVALAAIAAAIRAVGPQYTILSTDLGQADNPPPVAGMTAYLADLRELGFSWSALRRMAGENPAAALGLS